MILKASKLKDFFPSDNRFIHFVAKKNGMFFKNQDDLESARFFALEAVMRLVNSEYEFEDDLHLYSVVEMNVLRGIYRMIEWNSAKKNSQDIRPESDFIGADDEDGLRTHIQTAEAEFSPYDNTMDLIEEYAQEVLDDIGYAVYEMTLTDMSRKDIAEAIGVSAEAVRQRQNSNIEKLKAKYDKYENDKTNLQQTRATIHRGVRGRPTAKNKATECARSKANAFLHTQYEIPYTLSNS